MANFDFSAVLASATNATNSKDIYNYKGEYLSELVDKSGSTQKARKVFRKVLEKIALQFSQTDKTKKADFAREFWANLGENFTGKQIAKDSRLSENKHLNELQKAINNL